MSSLHYQKLLRELEDSLESVVGKEINPLKRVQETATVICKKLLELETYTRAHPFPDQAAEIYFFKEIKPRFVASLIYEVERYNLLINQPVGTKSSMITYYEDELQQLNRFYRLHGFHFRYYQLKATELDHLFFIRGAEVYPLVFPELPALDHAFHTPLDGLFAKFLAFERLQRHIYKQLDQLAQAPSSPASLQKSLRWTGETINLAELAYGLWLTGQLNNGNAGIAEIVRWLEDHFQVNIGRPHRRWTEISGRTHNSYTKFTDRMRETIRLRVNDELEAGALKRKARRVKE